MKDNNGLSEYLENVCDGKENSNCFAFIDNDGSPRIYTSYSYDDCQSSAFYKDIQLGAYNAQSYLYTIENYLRYNVPENALINFFKELDAINDSEILRCLFGIKKREG